MFNQSKWLNPMKAKISDVVTNVGATAKQDKQRDSDMSKALGSYPGP